MPDDLITAVRKPFVAFTGDKRQDKPVVAVDMGYSAKNKSCGLCWSSASGPLELQFGQSISKVADVLQKKPESILVIEAVLSTFHDSGTCNPGIRGEFESGRGWYYGAGVLSFAAAQRFLYCLAAKLPAEQVVPLAEAFLSNKDERTGHGDDARTIVTGFWDAPVHQPKAGSEPATPLIAGIPQVREFQP